MQASVGPVSPLCFQPMDARDSLLVNALRANNLLCPTSTRTGTPVRLRAAPGNELAAEKGASNAWHRERQ